MRQLLFLLFISLVVHANAQTDTVATGNHFTSVDGVKIYYETKGTGEPVLLVHGFTNTSENWKKSVLYNELVKQGFQVILIDLRGNGRSARPHTPQSYENDSEAKDIMQLMDVLKIKRYSVVGYSRGAIITARLLVFDSRVSNVVLGGMGADFTNPEWPRRKMFYRALMGESVPELDGFMKYVKNSGFDPLELAYMQHGQPSTSPEELGKVNRPVMVICGTEDEDNGSAKTLAEMIPSSTYTRVPGDHNSTASTKPFSEEVVRFLLKK
jgi:pimeloyl-ACP methyl ester carboxylesterase